MALSKGRKIQGLLGLSVLFSVEAAAGGRYNNDFYEEEGEWETLIDVSTLRFSVSLPYNGVEDNKLTEVHIGHSLIGDDLDTAVVSFRINHLNRYILPAVEGSYELTKQVLRRLQDCLAKQDLVILYTQRLVEKLLDRYEYTNENVHEELVELNNRQAQDSKLSGEELKWLEETFTSREVGRDGDLRITGFLRAFQEAFENYDNGEMNELGTAIRVY